MKKEVLDNVSNKLQEKKRINVDVMEVEIIDEQGNRKKESYQKNHQSPLEFVLKRKKNYQNEYTEAKKLINYRNDEEEREIEGESSNKEEEEKIDTLTLKNTLLNKVIGGKGKVNKQNKLK